MRPFDDRLEQLWEAQFSPLSLCCERDEEPGIDDIAGCNEWTDRETTPDQRRIEDYLDHLDLSQLSILHVGIGNSQFAARFAHRARSITGFTLSESEARQGEALGISNYRPMIQNKYSCGVSAPTEHFDIIVDNNPSAFACCGKHIAGMMSWYADRIGRNGVILSDRIGLRWVVSAAESHPRWSFDFDDWSTLGQLFGLKAVRITEYVYGLVGQDPPFGLAELRPAEEQKATEPLVSIVIPFLNSARFLQETLDSVFAQTYQNWELLLVDDGSTDASTGMARQYAERHPARVRYLEHEGHENRGQSASHNLGSRNARGEFIAYLDSDDIWLPQKLERQVEILREHADAGMVFGAPEYWRSWSPDGEGEQGDFTPELGVEANALYQPPELICLLYPLGKGTAPCPSDLMVRRTAFERTGGFREDFRDVYAIYQDQSFLARIYLREVVYISGECWTRYRIHAESCVATTIAAGKMPAARLYFLTYLEQYLTEEKVRDARLWNALRKALRKYGRNLAIDGLQAVDPREIKWELRVANGNSAQLEMPADEPELLRVVISDSRSANPWDIQLNQAFFRVNGGDAYTLVFRARSDCRASINAGFSRAHEPWDGLGLYKSVETTREWQAYSEDFAVSSDDSNARIHFDLGGDPGTVEIDSVALYRARDGAVVEPDLIGLYPPDRWELGGSQTESAELRFSIVIPTYQRRDLVVHSVRSLARQDFSQTFEVIVVVDGSTDGSAEALRQLQLPFALKVVEQLNQGAATARNRGAAEARGEILLFLDDDMEAHPRLLAEHEQSHRQGAEVVLGHFPLHAKSRPGFLSAFVRSWINDRARLLARPGVDLTFREMLSGQFSIGRTAFDRVKGFDAAFTAGGTYSDEDQEFGCRVLDGGYRTVFNPYALSYQNYIVTPRQALKQARATGSADVMFARKHPEKAGKIFAPYVRGEGMRVKPFVWRALAALTPLSTPLLAGFRAAALRLVESRFETPATIRFYFEIWKMEYWRGVQEAGGMPNLTPVRVLAYHAIQDLKGTGIVEPYGTPRRQFRNQLKMLQRFGFHFISADQFLRFVRSRERLPSRPVLLTFDDGYDDLLENALPVLRQLRVPAIVFAVSGLLGGANVWDQCAGAPKLRLLSAAGLQRLAESGIEIGAHSRSHPRLTEIGSNELQDEVAGSLAELERIGFRKPRVLAYPYGDSNEEVRLAARHAGYEAGFTTTPGAVHDGRDPYGIPRIEILREDKGWKFLWKVMNAI